MPDDLTSLREAMAALRGGILSVNESSGLLMASWPPTPTPGKSASMVPHGSPAIGISGTEASGGMVFYDVDGQPESQLP